MIQLDCVQCGARLRVPETRAGATTFCPTCGTRNQVPELAATGVAAEGGAAPAAPPRLGTPLGDDPYEVEEAASDAQAEQDFEDEPIERTFDPEVEDDLRRRNLGRVGLCMAAAFFAPIVGVPGQGVAFPELQAFPGMNLAGLVVALPLLAGLAVAGSARWLEAPLRGPIVLGAGLALFGLMFADRTARTMIRDSASALPTSISVSCLLLLAGVGGLIVGARTRWYRPASRVAFLVGASAAACYAIYLVLPAAGRMPIIDAFRALQAETVMGIAALANVGLLAAAGYFCARSVPGSPALDVVERARRATLCLAGALVLPLAIGLAAMAFSGASQMLPAMASGMLKYGVMYGGLMLLVPLGVSDLLLGRAGA